ncbi:MAG: hypothetical protein ACLP9L_37725, partial [Thermoguttaceae bacterium]
RIRQVDVAEVVAAALDELGPGRHAVDVVLPEDIPNVISDAAVLTRVVTALVANTIRLSSPGSTPKIAATLCGDRVEIRFQTGYLEQGDPLFLLPLWCSFYWRRGLVRFSLAVLVVLGIVATSLAFMPSSLGSYAFQFSHTFGLMTVEPPDIQGLWKDSLAPFRWPVIAAFVAICGSMAIWPAQKNLGSLLACSAAVMLGTQFWKAYEGGTFMAWYLPLLILTIFRPNLEDRVALSAISEGWVKWRK